MKKFNWEKIATGLGITIISVGLPPPADVGGILYGLSLVTEGSHQETKTKMINISRSLLSTKGLI